ncbi:MAG: hypothetical protein ACE5ES_05660 [Candidatus Nanoarchaeia archaeon]
MEIIIGIIVVVVLIYVIFIKQGNLKFWQKVQRNPDVAYKYFLDNDCWRVEDGINDRTQPSKDVGEWDGPFRFNVPSIGRAVKVYGKVGFYEQSQNELESIIE